MKIAVMAVGRTSADYLRKGIDMYLARLRHYIPVDVVVVGDVKATRSLPEEQQKEAEGRALLAALRPGDRVVLLDERGEALTSRQFADRIGRRMSAGQKRLVFIVGGPYGFSADVYSRADARLSLSAMTFSHEMVRLFFVEQLYRAMTILRGEPYHHD